MRILILDDDKELLSALSTMLGEEGHDVDTSDSPEAAVGKVESGEYDFVLVDYKMPENDGIWFMQNVTLPAKTKAILITAYVNRDLINRMFELGASGYLIKPFSRDDLMRHLEFFASG